MFAAKPENVGGAGQLLLQGSPIILGKSRILGDDAAGGRHRKAQDNIVHSHVPILLSEWVGVVVPPQTSGFKINEDGEGSPRTKNCECRSFSYPSVWEGKRKHAAPFLLHLADFFHQARRRSRSSQTDGVVGSFGKSAGGGRSHRQEGHSTVPQERP